MCAPLAGHNRLEDDVCDRAAATEKDRFELRFAETQNDVMLRSGVAKKNPTRLLVFFLLLSLWWTQISAVSVSIKWLRLVQQMQK